MKFQLIMVLSLTFNGLEIIEAEAREYYVSYKKCTEEQSWIHAYGRGPVSNHGRDWEVKQSWCTKI